MKSQILPWLLLPEDTASDLPESKPGDFRAEQNFSVKNLHKNLLTNAYSNMDFVGESFSRQGTCTNGEASKPMQSSAYATFFCNSLVTAANALVLPAI
jgi:hypothetical protein